LTFGRLGSAIPNGHDLAENRALFSGARAGAERVRAGVRRQLQGGGDQGVTRHRPEGSRHKGGEWGSLDADNHADSLNLWLRQICGWLVVRGLGNTVV